MFFKRLL